MGVQAGQAGLRKPPLTRTYLPWLLSGSAGSGTTVGSPPGCLASSPPLGALSQCCAPPPFPHPPAADLEDFLPPAQAAEAFLYLDIDGNGRISQGEVRESVAKIFQVGAGAEQALS